MTLPEFQLWLDGFRHREAEAWRRARITAWAALSATATKKIKPTDVFTLPSDENKTAARSGIGVKEHLALIAKYNRIKNEDSD